MPAILSKVIEKVAHEQTTINIDLASEVTIQQTVFYHFSMKKCLKDFDNRIYTGMILTDLQKTFDTINKILLDKLLPTGFSKNTICWYESYLAERHFTVKAVNWVSKFAHISCSVTQGLFLSPLLSLIYVSDMSQTVEWTCT